MYLSDEKKMSINMEEHLSAGIRATKNRKRKLWRRFPLSQENSTLIGTS